MAAVTPPVPSFYPGAAAVPRGCCVLLASSTSEWAGISHMQQPWLRAAHAALAHSRLTHWMAPMRCAKAHACHLLAPTLCAGTNAVGNPVRIKSLGRGTCAQLVQPDSNTCSNTKVGAESSRSGACVSVPPALVCAA